MIDDELTKKLAQAAMGIMAEDNTNNKSDDGEGLDKVQPKAVKKKFADRKDKDIDNDGDVDSSDEYLHKRRKAISKAMKKEGYHEGMPKTKGDMLNAMYGQLKNMKKDDLMAAYDKIMSSYHEEEDDLEESMTKQQAAKLKKLRKDIEKIEKEIDVAIKKGDGKKTTELGNKLHKARMAIVNFYSIDQNTGKRVFKEEVEVAELLEATELYKKGKITLTKFMLGRGKGAGLQINYGTKFIQVPEKDIKQLFEAMVYITRSVPQFKESVELEEASKDWEVVVTMGVNKLKKGQKTVVKARNSAEAIKKAAKAFNINDKLITGKVDANLKEETLEEGKFDKLQKKLGRINPETLSDVMDGKIKLNSAEKKEFDEFMKGVRRMFGEMYDPEKDHTKDPKSHVKLNKETGMYCVYDMKGKKHAEFKTKEEAEAYSIKHHDKLMNK